MYKQTKNMSSNKYTAVKACCICNSKELEKVLDMGKTPLANNLVDNCKESLNQKEYD